MNVPSKISSALQRDQTCGLAKSDVVLGSRRNSCRIDGCQRFVCLEFQDGVRQDAVNRGRKPQFRAMKLINFSGVVLLAALILGGCAKSSNPEQDLPEIRPKGARLSNVQAIHIAMRKAEREGCDLKNYNVRDPYCKFYPEERVWFVAIDGLVPMPGNHFAVTVDANTGEAGLRGGM